MNNQDSVKIMWQGKPVLTTVQLAKAYNCDPKNISKNFTYSKEYFIEGVHYFKLTGDDLRQFKAMLKQENGQPALFETTEGAETRHSTSLRMAEGGQNFCLEPPKVHQYAAWVYLWTYEGCIRHCKMLNTPEAWKMFGMLEKIYFEVIESTVQAVVEEEKAIAVTEDFDTFRARIKMQYACPYTEFALVYVLLLSNLTVKIGMTSNFTERVKQIKNDTGFYLLNFKTTPMMSKSDALKLESFLKEKYAPYCIGGEYFEVNFHEVCANF